MMTKDAAPRTTLDIMSQETAADPWPVLRVLREKGPVVWHETYNRWMITTDRAVRKIVVDFRKFTVEGTAAEQLFGKEAFISMDDRRRHDDLRNVWAEAFRAQGLQRLAPSIRLYVETLVAPVVERLRSGEAVDLSSTVCRALPTMVIAAMMGVPEAMLPAVIGWSDAMGAGGPAYLAGADAARIKQASADAKAAFADYLGEMILQRRTAPAEDLVSTLVHSDIAKTMSDEQLIPNLRQLLFAGNETTAKWLAQIFGTYAEQNDVRRALVRDPSLVPAANDEVMRWQGVVGTLARRVRGGPIELGGVTLADGDDVTCVLSAANRDPERYEDPDKFDIYRPAQPNLGFGVGFHNCLGSALAKMEAELVVNRLLNDVPDFHVAAPYHYSTLPMRGPVPVTLALGQG
jgi:cytochrome P450